MNKRNLNLRPLKDYCFLIVPILVTFLIYSISLKYGFRNFDEDILIKNFYVKKTLWEYIEKYFLIHVHGVSEAHGFSFSGIKNIHVSILGIPIFYFISFLFHPKPFLFHLWSLVLHCTAVYFFTYFCYGITKNKLIAFFSGLLWTLHPTNVEPVIWATNWAQPAGAAFYFYTLYKVHSFVSKGEISSKNLLFILIITIIQILLTEHTITLPIAIFFTVFYQLNFFRRNRLKSALDSALRMSLPSLFAIFIYWILRNCLIAKAAVSSIGINFMDSIERIFFFLPQVFWHELMLITSPAKLTIDQIDLLKIDKGIFGTYHISCIVCFIIFLTLIWFLRKKNPYLSFGLLMYLVAILPFSQIIPLYSLVAERYNYLSSAFILFGFIMGSLHILSKSNKYLILILIITSIALGSRSISRIKDWKNSETLFLSTINTSKTYFKKGIWTYNLAISQNNESKKEELLNLSINLLKMFIQNPCSTNENKILTKYELDNDSLSAKAAFRIATNYEILGRIESQHEYLLKALEFASNGSQVQAFIFKNLGTFYFQNNDFIKAIEYYTKSNIISPNPTTDYALSICYSKLSDYVNYEKHLEMAASVINPYNVSPFKTYGQFLELSKNDYKNAAKYYKIATLLENKPEPYVLLATVLLKQNQINKALNAVKNGLYGFPKNPSLIYLKAAIDISKGKEKEGVKKLIEIIDKADTPNDIKIEASNILVNIFLKNKDIDSAVKYNELIKELKS